MQPGVVVDSMISDEEKDVVLYEGARNLHNRRTLAPHWHDQPHGMSGFTENMPEGFLHWTRAIAHK